MSTKLGVIEAGGMLPYHHAGFTKAGGKVAPLNTPDQALHLMTIIDAIYESSKSGKAITL